MFSSVGRYESFIPSSCQQVAILLHPNMPNSRLAQTCSGYLENNVLIAHKKI